MIAHVYCTLVNPIGVSSTHESIYIYGGAENYDGFRKHFFLHCWRAFIDDEVWADGIDDQHDRGHKTRRQVGAPVARTGLMKYVGNVSQSERSP